MRPPGQPPPGWRRPRKSRRGWVITGSILGGLVLIGALADAFGKPATTPHRAAASTPAAVTATTPAAAPSPASCKQKVLAWKNTTMGFTYFTEATQDERRVAKAAGAGEEIAVEQDGANMATAAMLAKAHPIPKCADAGGYYPRAMADWERSGNLASAGNFEAAAVWVARGGRAFQKATVELDEVTQLEG